jgi:2-succinyl-6-hydroxy-2,4-cyclohexadiene-1-carboxylate synthase
VGAEPLETVAPDVPDGLDFPTTAGAIAEACGPGIYCGYSMGGRLCLRIALDFPDLVRGLVLVSASPGIADATARTARASLDDELASRASTIGVEPFIRLWLGGPLFATLEPDAGEVIARARAYSVRRLAHQLRVLGQGAQEPLWERLGELEVRVVIVTGRADEKYDAIGDQVARLLRHARRVRIDGGHSLLLEQPVAMAEVLVHVARDVTGHDRVS